ncbi:MAG TPA: peptidoglycan-associated lipoprotein Pal [Steroidobacteraceae bacterium]|jgi:peptidoglycan-associated lipoprotein|nr:peptidoglycan-associated lipoprotein Pal [Steroidobacteraceae bacterium]
MRKTLTVMLLASVLALGACSGKKVKPGAGSGGETVGGDSAQTSGANSDSASGGGLGSGASGPPGALGSQRVIYFEFDSSEIRAEFVDVIAAHGRFLAGNASIRVRLEGHSDERGTREYNIGLAERRAQTVKRALGLQGVQDAQVATVSYGEERPAAVGSDENAYSKNRRVEIVYIN